MGLSIKDAVQAKIDFLKSEVAKYEGFLAEVPSEFHTLEVEVLQKIHNFFYAPTPKPVSPQAFTITQPKPVASAEAPVPEHKGEEHPEVEKKD